LRRPQFVALAPRPVVPRWVRYPLEFQLCGIGLGTRAVDKDRFNRIDRYGLFAMHGNPTAVVVPVVTQTAGAVAPRRPPGAGAARLPGVADLLVDSLEPVVPVEPVALPPR
jgi:hypothetical protein